MVLLVPDNRVLLTTSHKTGLKISCLYNGDYCSLIVLSQYPRQINWALSLGFSSKDLWRRQSFITERQFCHFQNKNKEQSAWD